MRRTLAWIVSHFVGVMPSTGEGQRIMKGHRQGCRSSAVERSAVNRVAVRSNRTLGANSSKRATQLGAV